ncbi:hypothetical protein GCM10009720_22180 [Yaniella flava]|uniref:N-acetyltransferase domain-containing protein n=1 Tax=Yaniella flava TaxID=287930 RepID=A0ABP5G8H6_9MICC
MIEIAEDEPLTVQELALFQAGGRAWVSTDESDQPVAYMLLQRVDNCAHVEQVSVHPDHAGRRLGQDLIEFAASWADHYDLAGVTLTTFQHVPWNAPYYRRLGVVPREVVNTRGRKKTSGKDGVYHNTHRTGGLHVPP